MRPSRGLRRRCYAAAGGIPVSAPGAPLPHSIGGTRAPHARRRGGRRVGAFAVGAKRVAPLGAEASGEPGETEGTLDGKRMERWTMPMLYLVEQGAVLARHGERLIVRKGDERLLDIPVFQVEGVWIFGNIQVTTPAIGLLLTYGVETCFFTMEGRLKGRLTPILSGNVPLRLRQFERHRDGGFRLALARQIVVSKLTHARRLLLRHARDHPDPAWKGPLQALERGLAPAETAMDLATLRGIEGRSTAAYFEAFRRMVRGERSFEGRSRRPPRDPVNAMLSLGYALVTGELIGKIAAYGLDPYLGFYHEIRHGRPALALDMVEEFRHILVDRMVLALVNRRSFGPEDFIRREEDGGVLLQPEALRRYLAAYEAFMRRPTRAGQTMRKLLEEQIRRLVRAILHGDPYQPVDVER